MSDHVASAICGRPGVIAGKNGAVALRSVLPLAVLLSASFACAQTPSRDDIDVAAPDGTKLRATFFAAAKPGPGVLLLHMCNTTRKSWEPVAKGLSEKGINALTIDNRGFGESGGRGSRARRLTC
jgi:predicted alpha/beta hydrolase